MWNRHRALLAPVIFGLVAPAVGAGCDDDKSGAQISVPPSARPVASAGKMPGKQYEELDRARLNALAVRLNLPLYWASDDDGDKALDPGELRTLSFYGDAPRYVEDGRLTSAFDQAYAAMVTADQAPAPSGEDAERQRLVLEELDQGRPTLVFTDLSDLPADEKKLVARIQAAAHAIDDLYELQTGATALAKQVPEGDVASQSLFRRNRGPKCRGPKTEGEAACSAIPGAPKPLVDIYPASLQKDDDQFCEKLEKRPDAKQLFDPFVVVREIEGKLQAVPYHEAYAEPMARVAKELTAAADALEADKEEPLRTYLRAAAKAFGDNDWTPADEAWAAMNAKNSKWYLRVGPDETYWDPCSQKAGFHLTFARINKDSLEWQDKLGPHQQGMEDAIAGLIGEPYVARKVTFHLPDFIDIVFNAGDDRDAFGATIGQSLPNWGPVANEGRGRTVAMSNLYTDPDSQRMRREQAASLLDDPAFELVGTDAKPSLLATILHEAAHNLGPSHEYKVAGKTDGEAFGGGLASMLEELKAQTAALYLLQMLGDKGVIQPELKKQSYVDSLVWAMGHVSRGMWTDTGERKAYSQLAAIQIGFLLDEGAISFDKEKAAQNGQDKGAFSVDFDTLPAASEALMKMVATIKAKGDRAAAEALAKKYVDGDTVPHELIKERFLRFPKASFVYAVDL